MKKYIYPKTKKFCYIYEIKKFKIKRNHIINKKEKVIQKNIFNNIKSQFKKSYVKPELKREYSLDKLIKKFQLISITNKSSNENKSNLLIKDNNKIFNNNKEKKITKLILISVMDQI